MNRIALCIDLSEEQRARLRANIGDAELLPESAMQQCDIAFGNPCAEQIQQARTVRWVQLESVGFGEYADLDWIDLGKRLVLTNLAGFFADPVAETALAGLLCLYRGIDQLARLRESGSWVGDPIRTQLRLLRNAHVVMVGYGSINRRLAELLAPFNCRITPISGKTARAELDHQLTSADVVVCTAPDTPATRGLFDAKRLALLPDHAVFANLGRGSIVDEVALATALGSHMLGGAILDVTQEEPLSREHPLWSTPNTLLTQHSGGGTADELDRKIDVFLKNLEHYRHAEPLEGVVDMARGY